MNSRTAPLLALLLTGLITQPLSYVAAQAPIEGEIEDVPRVASEPAETMEESGGDSRTVDGATIQLKVGDIFEILPVHSLQNPSYTWILTQNRTFIEAMRTSTFRKRIIQPGTYSLFSEIASADGSSRMSKTFTLVFEPREPGDIPATGSTGTTDGTALVDILPKQEDANTIILKDGGHIVQLLPLDQTLRPLVLDLDTEQDANGDGNTRNDIASGDTFFQSDATPLFLWFTEETLSRTIAITAAKPEGAIVQEFRVFDEQTAMQEGVLQAPARIEVTDEGDNTFSFSSALPSGISSTTPLLYTWEFGDGKKSLLAAPTHTYAAEGTYTVTLSIQSLTNGQQISAERVEVEVGGTLTGGTTSSADAENTDGETGPGFLSTLPIGSILLYGAVFIGTLILGFLVFFLLSKLRKGSNKLADTFEAMEQTVVQKKEDAEKKAAPTLTIAPPVEKKDATPPPVVQKEAGQQPMNPKPEALPKVDKQNAPTWLKGGLNAEQQKAPAAAPTPAPKEPTPPSAPSVPPAPAAPSSPPVQNKAPNQAAQPAATPPWLKQNAQSPTQQKQTPTQQGAPRPMQPNTQPAPKAPASQAEQQSPMPQKPAQPSTAPANPSAMKPAPTPAPTPNAQPQQPATPAGNAPVPPWLKKPEQQGATATQQPAPTPAPKPETPKPAAPAPTTHTQSNTPSSQKVVENTPKEPLHVPNQKDALAQQKEKEVQNSSQNNGGAPSNQESSAEDAADEPIAIIRADSLEGTSNTPKPAENQQNGGQTA